MDWFKLGLVISTAIGDPGIHALAAELAADPDVAKFPAMTQQVRLPIVVHDNEADHAKMFDGRAFPCVSGEYSGHLFRDGS